MAEPMSREDYAEFVQRIRAGDERAAEDLVRLYEPEIRLEIRCRLRLRNPKLRSVFDSLDICQSVLASFFVRAAIGEFDLEDPRQLVPLLVRMARNKLAEQVRFHQRDRRDIRRVERPESDGWFQDRAVPSPSEIVASRELLDAFRMRLSDDERRVAELRSNGLDWGAVAEEIGGTAEGRRKQLARAIARVEQELGLGSQSG
jgi:RNA polymerase sigma-70 factor (ECF subfamily)